MQCLQIPKNEGHKKSHTKNTERKEELEILTGTCKFNAEATTLPNKP